MLWQTEEIMCDWGGVEEVQGLYGPFGVNEAVIQKAWADLAFDRRRCSTLEGQPVEVVAPGRWNRGPGPDFLGARLRIQGIDTMGDVEIHLREGQWREHGHHVDPAYARVVLHVVLFPGVVTRTFAVHGGEIPVLALLPYLNDDLETLVEDHAVSASVLGPAKEGGLACLAPEEVEVVLERCAARRWRHKLAAAGEAVARHGWETACHVSALETLGYPQFRPFFGELAVKHGLCEWREWRRQGTEAWGVGVGDGLLSAPRCRPANHPRARLAQYQDWVDRVPSWPEVLAGLVLPEIRTSQAPLGALSGWGAYQKRQDFRLHGNAVRGGKGLSLWSDTFLPLWAVRSREKETEAYLWWFALAAGDMSNEVLRSYSQLDRLKGARWPRLNGWAQGILGWHRIRGDPLASFLGAGT